MRQHDDAGLKDEFVLGDANRGPHPAVGSFLGESDRPPSENPAERGSVLAAQSGDHLFDGTILGSLAHAAPPICVR
jgi:hypothetical protein